MIAVTGLAAKPRLASVDHLNNLGPISCGANVVKLARDVILIAMEKDL